MTDPVPTVATGIERNVSDGLKRAAEANILPIAFAILPDDACTGNRHGICIRCARLYARGKHIYPAARRGQDGVSECVNWVHVASVPRESVVDKHLSVGGGSVGYRTDRGGAA